MSSSRRSSRSKSAGPCPSCGARRVVAVTEAVTLRVGGRSHTFEAVAHERCAECGERIFGLEVSRRFDAAILSRRRRATAAR
jgi:YgiT-type zinc finger domain-containing protein